ncbi:hypothetical protein HK105_202813 [Polyrhizophydium stewartii]|uniref:Cyclic nucleotide-binding domain-containing protein n=1 Tax=Polyrhizophydium stewartii TaxID=2732419 RepID=A0ABR4NDC5_9FUNG
MQFLRAESSVNSQNLSLSESQSKRRASIHIHSVASPDPLPISRRPSQNGPGTTKLRGSNASLDPSQEAHTSSSALSRNASRKETYLTPASPLDASYSSSQLRRPSLLSQARGSVSDSSDSLTSLALQRQRSISEPPEVREKQLAKELAAFHARSRASGSTARADPWLLADHGGIAKVGSHGHHGDETDTTGFKLSKSIASSRSSITDHAASHNISSMLKHVASKSLAAEVAEVLSSSARHNPALMEKLAARATVTGPNPLLHLDTHVLPSVAHAVGHANSPKYPFDLKSQRRRSWRQLFYCHVLCRNLERSISCMKWKEMSMSIKTNDVMASEVFKSMITKCVSTNENPVVDKIAELLRSDRTGDVAEQLEKLIGMQNRKFRSFTYDQRLTFCRVMRFEEHDTRKIVIKEGHAAQAFYFILTGEVIVFRIKDNHWIQVCSTRSLRGTSGTNALAQLNILGRGESFGDRSMNVLNDKRTAYIATNKRSQFLVVDKRGFLEKIAPSCEILNYEPNSTIIAEGSMPFQMFWILRGTCPGMKRVNLLLTVAELGPGDCFPLLPWPHATPPMTPFDKAEFEHSLALDDVAASWNWTNSSVITTSTVEVVVVPRRDLVRIAPGEMLCEMTTDTFNGTTLHAVQAAFIEKQRWDGFKRKTINEVTRRKSRT